MNSRYHPEDTDAVERLHARFMADNDLNDQLIELQDKNGALVDLREQLVASQAEVQRMTEAASMYCGMNSTAKAQLAARDKRLEEAVGLLERAQLIISPIQYNWHFHVRAFLSQSDEAKEND